MAGTFYPPDPAVLAAAVKGYVEHASVQEDLLQPKALILPHAGYVYSGPVAASGYALLQHFASTISRVVLVGPSHRVALRGLAASSAEAFATPLGTVPVDTTAVARVLELPQVHVLDEAHAFEHCLEVHLPFLQWVLESFAIVPLVAGEASAESVAEVLEELWGGNETLVVVSSDLSHYHDYETARRLDAATSRAIEHLDSSKLGAGSACGRVPVSGLLLAAKRHGLEAMAIDVRSSGDTAGGRDEVVGYGAYVFI
jgi:AmmeMemoRadiSam system protein B